MNRWLFLFPLIIPIYGNTTLTEHHPHAKFDFLYPGTTPTNGTLRVYTFDLNETDRVRLSLESNNATALNPLLAVIRQPASISSIQLPLDIADHTYTNTTRTVCPYRGRRAYEGNYSMRVELSSNHPVNYTLIAHRLKAFDLKFDKPVIVQFGAADPVYYQYTFSELIDAVQIWVDAEEAEGCTTVTVVDAECPIYDLQTGFVQGGLHQTMTTSGTITVEKAKFSSFFVIFVVHPDNRACISPSEEMKNSTEIRKKLRIQLQPLYITKSYEFIYPLVGVSLLVFILILMKCISSCDEVIKKEDRNGQLLVVIDEEEVQEDHEYMPMEDGINLVEDSVTKLSDYNEDASKDYQLIWFGLAIAVFFVAPVLSHLLYWNENIRSSGNLDLCWYNFRCAHKFWIFIAFNNIFSNIPYLLFGLVLIKMAIDRKSNVRALPKDHGVFQNNDVLLTIGVFLIVTGVCSALYHVCPNLRNFQYDTTFMFFLGVTGIVQLYLCRHPCITTLVPFPKSSGIQTMYSVVSVIVAISTIGIYLPNFAFFCIVLATFGKSYVVITKIYLQDIGFKRRSELSCSSFRIKASVAEVALNVALLAIGGISMRDDICSLLLFSILIDLALYVGYYTYMKYLHGEIRRCSTTYIASTWFCLAVISWSLALYFFLSSVSEWRKTPAESRALNHDCLFLTFDNHDVWHFLSSIALFSSFAFLHYIDQDLNDTPRSRIDVF